MQTRWLVSVALVAALIGFLAGSGFSEDPPQSAEEMMKMMVELGKPGPAHKALQPMIGDWDVTSKMWMGGPDPIVSSAKARNTWTLDGRFMEMDYDGEFSGKPFHGRGFMGHDNFKKQYQGIWMDSMGSTLTFSSGSASDDGRTFTMLGAWEGPMGKFPTRYVYAVHNDDKYVLTSYASYGDKEVKEMELTFIRRKAAAPASPCKPRRPRRCPPPASKGPGY